MPNAAEKRLAKEYQAMEASPVPYIRAVPNESNLYEWHYVITGSPETPYENGQYHGTLYFPNEYPFKPPAIRMITPSGRFKTNTRLCLSISDFHPDTWNPAWSVSTILIGLQSFMNSEDLTTGAIRTSDAEKQKYARQSIRFNVERNPAYCKHYPDDAEYYRNLLSSKSSTKVQPGVDSEVTYLPLPPPPPPKPVESSGGSLEAGQDSKESGLINEYDSDEEEEEDFGQSSDDEADLSQAGEVQKNSSSSYSRTADHTNSDTEILDRKELKKPKLEQKDIEVVVIE